MNSYHHQAIQKIAPDLDIIAWHEDDTIEAVVHRHLPMIGVQWHPEVHPESDVSRMVFDAFQSMFK